MDTGNNKIQKTLRRVYKEIRKTLSKRDCYFTFPEKAPGSKTVLVLRATKTKKHRTHFITPELLHEFRLRKQQVEKNKVYYGEEYHDYNLVFCYDNGDPIESKECWKKFVNWREKQELGLPYITFHGLRHTGSTILCSLSNGNLKIQKQHPR